MLKLPILSWLSHCFPGKRARPGPCGDSFTAEPLRLLLLSDSEEDHEFVRVAAQRYGWDALLLHRCEDALPHLRVGAFSIIICDRDLPGFDWRDTVEMLVASAPDASVLLTSPVNDDFLWQEVIQRGGYDVLVKPFEMQGFSHTIDQAWWFWRTSAKRPQTHPAV